MTLTSIPTTPTIAIDDVILAVPSQPTNPSSDSSGPKSFRTVFEEHMPSSRTPISHSSASALLLSYDSSNKTFAEFDVRNEVQRLEDVFRNDYGFHVEQRLIESNNSAQLQMHAHLSNFSVNYGKDHALLIVYYAGHGWHSCDRSRENPGRFDLHPRKLEYQEVPSGDELVMWEVSETILHHVKGDVLVIFDCCDTGSLAKLRSAGRAFEYLGACDGGKYTYEPGEKSFTSALTWALKTMSSEPAFTTADLVAKIKTHRRFPTNQKPVLFPRWDFMPEHIWISSRRTLVTRTSGRHRSRSAREFRDENCDFVDFRVTFSRPLGDEDGKAVAEMMGPLVCNRKLPLNARHVSFLRKGTCKSRKDLTALWNRAQNHIIATQRLRKTVDIPDTKLNQKRKRPSFDADSEDPSLRKYPKSSLVSDSEHAAQLPATPSSGNPDSDPEGTSRLRISTNIGPSSGILESSFEMESDPMHRAEALLRDLEKLKLYALHQPEFQRAFLSQIQARFMS